jgi:hypothetical protein
MQENRLCLMCLPDERLEVSLMEPFALMDDRRINSLRVWYAHNVHITITHHHAHHGVCICIDACYSAVVCIHQVGYVEQSNVFLPTLTVREILLYNARMRLSEQIPDSAKISYVPQPTTSACMAI